MQEKEQTTGAGMQRTQKKSFSQRFTGRRIALMALFVALSYVVSRFEFPIFPAAGFLKLDFGNVFILLISFLLGPVEGLLVCALKESLRMIGTNSGGVGELANMLVTAAYIALPSIVYVYRKGIKTVVLCLIGACMIGTGAALLANRFIMFPLYEEFLGMSAAEGFALLWWAILAFNLIKTAAVGVLTLLLYKRLSGFLKKMKI